MTCRWRKEWTKQNLVILGKALSIGLQLEFAEDPVFVCHAAYHQTPSDKDNTSC